MDVIASTGFGIDLDTQSTTNHPFVENAGLLFGIPRKDSRYSKIRSTVVMLTLCKFIHTQYLTGRMMFQYSSSH